MTHKLFPSTFIVYNIQHFTCFFWPNLATGRGIRRRPSGWGRTRPSWSSCGHGKAQRFPWSRTLRAINCLIRNKFKCCQEVLTMCPFGRVMVMVSMMNLSEIIMGDSIFLCSLASAIAVAVAVWDVESVMMSNS